MGEPPLPDGVPEPPDIGEYCRGVEAHLARVNAGQIVRIAGTSFELVRGWALEGIPLAIVYRGIEQKAERHRAGRSKRPLRLEFCEHDVRALYDDWRRAVGAPGAASADRSADAGPVIEERRRPSVARQLDRAMARIAAAAGRLETPEPLRDALSEILEQLAAVREQLRHARGDARRQLVERVADIDRAIGEAARRAADVSLADVELEAGRELAAFRQRMSPAAWQRSIDAAVDRLLRERFGLPAIDVAVIAHDA